MCFIGLHMVGVANNRFSLNFLAADFRVTYVGYISAGKIVIKHKSVLILLMNLDKNTVVTKNGAITHLGDPILYILSRKDSLLTIQATYVFLKNKYKTNHSTKMLSTDTQEGF